MVEGGMRLQTEPGVGGVESFGRGMVVLCFIRYNKQFHLTSDSN